MQVGQQHRVEIVVVDPQLGQRHQAGGAEVDGEAVARRLDQDAGLKAAADAEGVARTGEGDGDAHSAASPSWRSAASSRVSPIRMIQAFSSP